MVREYIAKVTDEVNPDAFQRFEKYWSPEQEIVRCKDCKHLFDGEFTDNCCDVLMEKAGWLKEISVKPDWFCADGERR